MTRKRTLNLWTATRTLAAKMSPSRSWSWTASQLQPKSRMMTQPIQDRPAMLRLRQLRRLRRTAILALPAMKTMKTMMTKTSCSI